MTDQQSIFGPHVQPNGRFIRSFFNGRTMREEAWLEEVIQGREGANWKAWFVNDINDGGQCTRHHTLKDAEDDYNRRVESLISQEAQ